MKKKIIIIDNYDSFTYNLVQCIEQILGYKVDIFKNDQITVKACHNYEYIIISPGPGLPKENGHTMDIIKANYKSKKILGVCLGLQSIVEVFGGRLKRLPRVYHGYETPIYIKKHTAIYNNINKEFMAGRYHSWVCDKENFPEELEIDSIDKENEIMGLHHKEYPLYGVQFHPESIMTPDGPHMLRNFLSL